MKYLRQLTFIFIAGILMLPSQANASNSNGGFGGELELVNIGQQVVDFLAGPIAIIVITLGIIAGAVTIVFARQNDQEGYRKLGKAVIGGSILVGATSLVSFLFNGALL